MPISASMSRIQVVAANYFRYVRVRIQPPSMIPGTVPDLFLRKLISKIVYVKDVAYS